MSLSQSIRHALCGVGLIAAFGVAAVPQSAHAQGYGDTTLPSAPQSMDLKLGFRGVGEVWQDANIIHHYRSSNFGGTGFAAYGLTNWLMMELELGYLRQSSAPDRTGVASGAIELAPISLSACARLDTSRAEVFAGLGYAMAVFTEQTDVGTISGVKPGFDIRTGVRVHTNFVQTSIRPNAAPSVQGMDLEFMFGRRQHHAFGLGTGFDFSAWRVGLGLVARL